MEGNDGSGAKMLSVSWDVPQQPNTIAEQLVDDLGSHGSSPNFNFSQKGKF